MYFWWFFCGKLIKPCCHVKTAHFIANKPGNKGNFYIFLWKASQTLLLCQNVPNDQPAKHDKYYT